MPRHAAVLGRPIEHSLSPVLHRAAYAALGLDWSYSAIDCGADELATVLRAREDWAGFSCTMPLKHVALAAAADVRPVARAVGAANTLLPGPEGWIAENTDVAGILAALAEYAVAPRSATVLGAGGTAQAALAALVALGVPDCTVLVRAPSRTGGLLETAQRLGVRVQLGPLVADADALAADLVVSTLPRGAADPVAGWPWTPAQAVLDVGYSPWPTPLAAAATAAGAKVISGALMLLHQAAVQVELMAGAPAPVDEMRAALAAARPGCGV
jgi:shikimate dehydrogenase